MKKLLFSIVAFVFTCTALHAQNSLSFYHLSNATFQSRFFNPAFVPEGKWFIGLPVISGVHFNYNNKVSYSDVIINGEVENEIDLDAYLRSLQKNNMVSVSTAISLFHLGFTTAKGMGFSVFANERVEMDFLYPKSLMQFVIKGNASLAGEQVKIGKTRFSAVHYREFGFGLTKWMPESGLSVGINVKYLQGFANVSTPGNFTADLETDPIDYAISLDMKNASLRTSGLGIVQGKVGELPGHLLGNRNRGAALDMGFNLQLNHALSVSGSLTDLGFIAWKENIRTHDIGDTTMTYSGLDLKDVVEGDRNLEETFRDSLINKFKNKRTGRADPYTTMLAPELYLSGTYHALGTGDVIGTISSRLIQGQMKLLFGAGYRHHFGKLLTTTINVTRLPQQFLNLGGSLALNGGPAQMYLAVDQLVNFDATQFQSLDVRFGINFILREKVQPIKVTGVKAGTSSTDSFLGSKVRVKKKEGIYTIINKQKRRKRSEFSQN